MATRIGRRTAKILEKQEKEVYKRLLVVLAIIVFLVVVLFLWGIQILVKFAEVLDFFQGQRETTSQQNSIPPQPPNLNFLPSATNSAQITITGKAESGSSVEVFVNNQSKARLLVGSDGKFKTDELTLKEGENLIEAIATDNAGGKSQPSETNQIIYDKTKPPLEVQEPNEGATIIGQNNKVAVKGLTEPGATVTVNGLWAIVDQDGKFEYNFPLSDGENILTIESSDLAGNVTTVKRKVFYTH